MTARQRLHLLVPLVAIVAIVTQAALVVSGPRPETIPDPTPVPPAFQGTQKVDSGTLDDWLRRSESVVDGRGDAQQPTAAGISRDGRWGYLAISPAKPGGNGERHLFFRESEHDSWAPFSSDLDGVRDYKCHRKIPPEIQRLLRRDKFRCW